MNVIKSAIVLPFHDPKGLYFSHLYVITPLLKQLFSQAFLSISPATQEAQSERVRDLMEDDFFNVNFNAPNTFAGDHYQAAYQNAVSACVSNQTLHLCDIDKVAFILQSEYQQEFIADVENAETGETPLLFQRSQKAWQTYPKNYREIEHLGIKAGEYIFGEYVDVAWSHLIIRVSQLEAILPYLKSRDFGLLAEILLLLKDTLTVKEVDWLSWEDPFIYSRDSAELMMERDNSIEETRNRLIGLKSIMQILLGSVETQ